MNEVVTQPTATALESVLIGGDLSKLSVPDRVMYYKKVCESVGLNPLTKPFEYITLNNKLTLYARRDATDQLRQIHKVSINIIERELVEDCYVVTARATTAFRQDESIGAVNIAGLKGDARANAMMKAETKAKRRVTLSICGLGMLDETEVETIPGAQIKSTSGVMAALPGKDQDMIAATAQEIRAFIGNDQHSDAYTLWQDSRLDADQTVALWGCLNSKERKILERIDAETKAAEAGTISPAQKKRLEARIKETGLDRDYVKEHATKAYGVAHFQDLTREQYESLYKALDTLSLDRTAPPQVTSSEPQPALPPVPAGALPKAAAQDNKAVTQNAGLDAPSSGSLPNTSGPASAAPDGCISEVQWLTIENALDLGGKVLRNRFKAKMAVSGWKDVTEIPESKFKECMAWISAAIDRQNAETQT